VRRKPLVIIVIVLLVAVVGFLAIDRSDKMVGQERDKAFDKNFAK
jgi:F0F1-type ATP synthase assembly protein I